MNFFVRLVLGRPRVCPGASPYFTQWKPGKPGFVPGTSPIVPGTIPGTKGGTKSLCENSLCAFFARYDRSRFGLVILRRFFGVLLFAGRLVFVHLQAAEILAIPELRSWESCAIPVPLRGSVQKCLPICSSAPAEGQQPQPKQTSV